MIEVWKDIKGYENLYQVSNMGRVRSVDKISKNRWGNYFKKGVIQKERSNCHGYVCVALYNEQGVRRDFKIHRLVAQTFLPNENNRPVVMHLDNNKKNNVVTNLKWGTYSENTKQAVHDGLLKGRPSIYKGKKGLEAAYCRPIEMLDLEGKTLKKFVSIREANVYLGKLEESTNIVTCLRVPTKKGGFRTAYGYRWKYSHE